MEIRYDLVSDIERLMLLENSIKTKLEDVNEYSKYFETIFQIKLLQKIFNLKTVYIKEEINKDKDYWNKNNFTKETIRTFITRCIEDLNVIFVCNYKGTEIEIECKHESIIPLRRQLEFMSYLGDELNGSKYAYMLSFELKDKQYNGAVTLDIPKNNQIINKKVIEENLRIIRKHMDAVLDKFKAYEYNKEILMNM